MERWLPEWLMSWIWAIRIRRALRPGGILYQHAHSPTPFQLDQLQTAFENLQRTTIQMADACENMKRFGKSADGPVPPDS